jgi:hypothetical protein
VEGKSQVCLKGRSRTEESQIAALEHKVSRQRTEIESFVDMAS